MTSVVLGRNLAYIKLYWECVGEGDWNQFNFAAPKIEEIRTHVGSAGWFDQQRSGVNSEW